MNEKIIAWAKKYVNMLLWPLENHYYHHYNHALDVMKRALELWEKENISQEEMELLALWALFHDVWFIVQYDDNENIWASIAKNYLRWFLYDSTKIQIVENIILATKPDYKAQTLLEQIIKDADCDNLWRDDFFEKWEKIKKEIEIIKNIKIKDNDWYHYSINFLKQHKFMTKTEIEERQNKKNENIKKLEEILSKIK